ncbi:MAG: type II secretion system protein [Patescibacteria group bacterium]|nr:type II secretion system protein [Patescibacteria group bacterium]
MQMKKNGLAKGFTLLELLIVIAILAVLSTIVVLVLNPAEYLKQARDAQRLTDLKAVSSALNLYLSSVTSPSLGTCAAVQCSTGGTTIPGGTSACTQNTGTDVNLTTSWVTVKLTDITSGSPIARYPIDPTSNATYHYAYHCSSTANTYELNAKMESDKYKNGGGSDMESKDGGNNVNVYETGNAPGLILIPAV